MWDDISRAEGCPSSRAMGMDNRTLDKYVDSRHMQLQNTDGLDCTCSAGDNCWQVIILNC